MRTFRAGGSLLLLALFPVLVVGLIAGLAWVVYFAFTSSHGFAGAKLLFVVVPFAYAVVVALRQVLSARPEPAVGHEITRSEHPRLWAAADGAASGVGTGPADRLVVVPDVNAAVTQAAGRRELLLGLPLLATLTTGELRSVLAHEFGHFGAGHTRLTALTWRAHALMHEVAQRTEGAMGWVMRGYAKLAGRLTAASSRDQEWEADAYAARLTDPATAASALRRVVDADLGMSVYLQSHFALTGPAARRAPIAQGLIKTMSARSVLIDSAATDVLNSDSTGDWSDTHPPIRARIAAFEAMPAGTAVAPADGDSPAYELLDGGIAAFDPIELQLTGDSDPVASWDEVVDIAGRAISTGRTNAYLDETGLRARARTIGEVIALAPHIETRAAFGPLVPSDVPAMQRDEVAGQQVTDFVTSSIAATLTASGLARFVVDWSELWDLVHIDGREIRLRDRVAAVVTDPAKIDELTAYVRELGLDLDTPLPLTTPQPTSGAVSGG
ncbi:hypothetical protein JNB_07574 [Janibacter sp. HTCC2649]|uniref:M48 family metalloprotease n=1 Tax=Janibacter sp. HTCC2649 TaxID=313589 RepID=UPI0000670C74|nr:M48 family metallopeptidase [Janibacter sp. HTCC2649]EAQ00012.1 hypothetical protein JNB_07574 [Janibacter sp. HTCC2649]